MNNPRVTPIIKRLAFATAILFIVAIIMVTSTFNRIVHLRLLSGSLTKGNDGWWTFYHNIAGESRMKYISDPKFGILDHVLIGGGLEWHVFVRIIPNEGGSTVTWTFIKPDGLSDDQFHKQLTSFDSEISNWKSTLERNEK